LALVESLLVDHEFIEQKQHGAVGDDGGELAVRRSVVGTVRLAEPRERFGAPELVEDLAGQAVGRDLLVLVLAEDGLTSLGRVDGDDADLAGPGRGGQQLGGIVLFMGVLGDVPESHEGVGLAAAEARGQAESDAGLRRVGKTAEDGLDDLLKRLRWMCVAEEGLGITIDGMGRPGDQLAKVGGEDGVLQVTLEHLVSRFARFQHTHGRLPLLVDRRCVGRTPSRVVPSVQLGTPSPKGTVQDSAGDRGHTSAADRAFGRH